MASYLSKLLAEQDEEQALADYAARLPVTETAIDPQTGFPYNRTVVPELKLPVQGTHDYVAGSGDVRPPLQWFPSVQGGIENVKAIAEEGPADWSTVKDRLFGSKQGKIVNTLGGRAKVEPDAPFAERFQMWPEKMVRSGINLPVDVMSGAVQTGVGLRRSDYSDDPYAPQPLSHLIERTQDLAGMAAGGSIAATGLKAEAPGAISRAAKTLHERLKEYLAEDAEAGTAIGAARNANRVNESMPEILNRQRASEGYEAAIRDPETKKLYTGMWHEEVMDKMAKDKGISRDQLPENLVKGYIDYNGRFLTEAQLEKRSQSKSAMFRSDDEAGTAISASINAKNKGKPAFDADGNELTDYHGNPIRTDEDGKITLYHRTNEQSKKAIYKTGNFKSKENTNETFFADNLDSEYGKGFGDHVVKVRIDPKHVRLNDQFPNGENHFAVSNKRLNKSVLAADDIVGTGVAAAANAPRFYSGVERAIESQKANKAAPEQWLGPRTERTYTVKDPKTGKEKEVTEVKYSGTLGNIPGVTVEELEHLGLPEWIAEQKKLGKKSISKEEIQKHINENKVELQETVLDNNQGWRREDLLPDGTLKNQPSNATRFAQYQLPGGTNYREMLLGLKDNPKKAARVQEINDELAELKNVSTAYARNDPEFKEIRDRKIALAQERLELEQSFSHDHWPNNKDVLVHSRMNDRFIPDENGPSHAWYDAERWNNLTQEEKNRAIEADPNKGHHTLHAEEIQSDWHQKGNSEGYKLSPKLKAKLEPEFNKIDEKIIKHAEDTKDESIVANPDLKDAIKTAIEKKVITKAEGDLYLRYSAGENLGAVPDAPFKSNWSDLMIKRLIRQAAEEGKDAISWTPGQAQIDRYPGLQKHFDRIEYNPRTQDFSAYGKDGNVTRNTLNQSQLVDYIGKEATDKLLNNPSRKAKNDVNFKGFEHIELGEGPLGGPAVYGVKANGEKIIVKQNFKNKKEAELWVNEQNTHILDNADLKVGGEFHKKFYDEILLNKVNAIAKKFGGRVEEKEIPTKELDPNMRKISEAMGAQQKQKIWFLKLTPELKKHALEKGFNMFETGLPLTPVSHDPFADQKKKPRLIPVDHNPFQ